MYTCVVRMHNIFLLWIPLICSRVRPLIMSHLHKWHWWAPPPPVDCSCMHSAKWHLYNNQDGKRTNVIAWFTFKGNRTDCIQSGELLSLYLLHLETIYLTLQLLEELLTSSKLVAWRLVPDPLYMCTLTCAEDLNLDFLVYLFSRISRHCFLLIATHSMLVLGIETLMNLATLRLEFLREKSSSLIPR